MVLEWVLAGAVKLPVPVPVPATGQLGLWDIELLQLEPAPVTVLGWAVSAAAGWLVLSVVVGVVVGRVLRRRGEEAGSEHRVEVMQA